MFLTFGDLELFHLFLDLSNDFIIQNNLLSLIVVAFIHLFDINLGGLLVKKLAHGFKITVAGKSDFVLIIKIGEVVFLGKFFEDFIDVFLKGLEGGVALGIVDVALPVVYDF